MVGFKYWSPPCCLGITCVQSVAGSALPSVEASGKYWNSSQNIWTNCFYPHFDYAKSEATVDCLRFVFHKFLTIPDPSSTWYSSSAECTAASHLIPADMSCYADACIGTAILKSFGMAHSYWWDIDELLVWVLFSSIMVFWLYSELVFA